MRLLAIRIVLAAAAAGAVSSVGLVDPSRAQSDLQGDAPTTAGHDSHALPGVSREETLRRIDVAERELKAMEEELGQLEQVLDREEAATEELRAETSLMAEDTLNNAIDLYRHREEPATFVAAEELSTAMRAAALGRAAVAADTDGFDDYRSLLKDLEIQEAALAARRQQVDGLLVEVAVLDDELLTELLWFGELEELRIQQQAKMESVQASLRAQYQGRKQGFYLTRCPVNGPNEFVDSWGFARSGGRRHKGVDMLADAGTELVAPVSGQVEHATNSLGGLVFRLVDDNGNYYYGAHLSAFGKEGRVLAGEVIGYVGDSGNAAGINHLHFEIHPGGRGDPVNPFLDTATVCSGEIR